MSAAQESVRAEWAARSIVLSELRSIGEWQRLSGRADTREQIDAAVSRFLRALEWERVR